MLQNAKHKWRKNIRADLGAEFEDGVFISKLDENGSGAESGLTAGARIIHVNGIPVYDVMHTRALIDG